MSIMKKMLKNTGVRQKNAQKYGFYTPKPSFLDIVYQFSSF
jgi:hypothetical protein